MVLPAALLHEASRGGATGVRSTSGKEKRAKESLLIEISSPESHLRPTRDTLASAELFRASQVLGTLQRECLALKRQLKQLSTPVATADPTAPAKSATKPANLAPVIAARRPSRITAGGGAAGGAHDETARAMTEAVDEWTERALGAILEAYNRLADVEERCHAHTRLGERSEREAAASAAWAKRLREEHDELKRESGQQISLLKAQLLARTTALATLRSAYYREVVRIKRQLIMSGAVDTRELSPLFEPSLRLSAEQEETQARLQQALTELEGDHALICEGLGLACIAPLQPTLAPPAADAAGTATAPASAPAPAAAREGGFVAAGGGCHLEARESGPLGEALRVLRVPWLEREYDLYHFYMMQVAGARLHDLARVEELTRKCAAHGGGYMGW